MNSGHISFRPHQRSLRKRRRRRWEIVGMSGTGLGATDEIFNHWERRESRGHTGPPMSSHLLIYMLRYTLIIRVFFTAKGLRDIETFERVSLSVPFCHSELHSPPWGEQTGWEESGWRHTHDLGISRTPGTQLAGWDCDGSCWIFPSWVDKINAWAGG